MSNQINWLDTAGEKLEELGFNPGCIFEFHDELLSGQLSPGGVVATNLEPGCPPRSVFDIERIVLRHEQSGELHIQGSGWPLFLANSHKITEYL